MNCSKKIIITRMFYLIYYLFSISIFDSEAIGKFPDRKLDDDEGIGRYGSSRTGSKAQEMCDKYTLQACRGYYPPRINASVQSKKPIMNKGGLQKSMAGISANPREFPHMALVCEDYGEGNLYVICEGTLISHNFILTAAHCVSNKANMVRLGDFDNADDGVTVDLQVMNRYVYPRYKEEFFPHNDCGLLKIRPLYQFNDFYRPICLHIDKDIQDPNFFVVRWGDLKVHDESTTGLRKVELKQMDPKKCELAYGPLDFHDERDLCIDFESGGRGKFPGDTGGPLEYQSTSLSCSRAPIHMQVGIASGAVECTSKECLTVFARVSHYIPWIESIVWK